MRTLLEERALSEDCAKREKIELGEKILKGNYARREKIN